MHGLPVIRGSRRLYPLTVLFQIFTEEKHRASSSRRAATSRREFSSLKELARSSQLGKQYPRLDSSAIFYYLQFQPGPDGFPFPLISHCLLINSVRQWSHEFRMVPFRQPALFICQ